MSLSKKNVAPLGLKYNTHVLATRISLLRSLNTYFIIVLLSLISRGMTFLQIDLYFVLERRRSDILVDTFEFCIRAPEKRHSCRYICILY